MLRYQREPIGDVAGIRQTRRDEDELPLTIRVALRLSTGLGVACFWEEPQCPRGHAGRRAGVDVGGPGLPSGAQVSPLQAEPAADPRAT